MPPTLILNYSRYLHLLCSHGAVGMQRGPGVCYSVWTSREQVSKQKPRFWRWCSLRAQVGCRVTPGVSHPSCRTQLWLFKGAKLLCMETRWEMGMVLATLICTSCQKRFNYWLCDSWGPCFVVSFPVLEWESPAIPWCSGQALHVSEGEWQTHADYFWSLRDQQQLLFPGLAWQTAGWNHSWDCNASSWGIANEETSVTLLAL